MTKKFIVGFALATVLMAGGATFASVAHATTLQYINFLPLASAPTTCNVAASGTVYVATDLSLKVCNGTSFVNVFTDTDTNNYPTSIAFSGTGTKTLTLGRNGLTNLTANFTDIDTDTTCNNATCNVTNTGTLDGHEGSDFFLAAGGTVSGDITVGGGDITISKSGTDSNIIFPAQTNDPGYIKHYENANVGVMYFSASDDYTTGDYFSFGSTPSGSYNEGARLTTSGNLQIDGTLTVSGASGTINGGTIWHSGNDGAGSGLDADLLDGQSGTYYLDNTDAQTLSFTSPNLSISGGNSVNISGIDTDTNNYPTVLSVTGTTSKTITLSRSGLTDLTAAFTDNDSGGDIQGVTAGTNLSGGGTSGTVTLNVVSNPTFSGQTSIGGGALVAGATNELWTQPQTNANAILYINHRGYADGVTQFRDLSIRNGKGGDIAYFQGSTSNVGIGNTNPTSKLQVSGTFAVNGTASDFNIASNGTVSISSSAVGSSQLLTLNGDAGFSDWPYIRYSEPVVSGLYWDVGMASGGTFFFNPNGAGNKFTIDGSGNVSMGGDLTVSGNDLNFGAGARVTGAGTGVLQFLLNTADDGAYEWLGFYSGATRQGIILYDGAWSGCANSASDFCLVAENGNRLVLVSGTSDVYVNDQMAIGSGAYDTGAVVSIGDAAVDYPGNSGWASTWNSNIVLSGLNSTSISFHDAGARVDTLRVTGGTFYLGENVGWGTAGLNVGSGSGKIDAGTVDPPYIIGGKPYATYMPGMTGVKEETTGVVKLKNGAYTLDFTDAPEGSDLWLFAHTVNMNGLSYIGKDGKVYRTTAAELFDKMTVLVSAAFDGKVWYEKDVAGKRITIHGSENNGEVSYRLTAPRFDHEAWSNRRAEGETGGFNLDTLLQ